MPAGKSGAARGKGIFEIDGRAENIFPVVYQAQTSERLRSERKRASTGAKRFCRVVTQMRTRIKDKPCFACSRAGGENSLSTLDWGKSAIRTLFSADFIFPIDRAAIPEYGYGNSNPKPLSKERHTMTHYFCIAIGMADFMPDSQDYHTAENETEFREILKSACEVWEADEAHGDEFFAYDFRMPGEGEDNYSQRLRVARSIDYVLDVIGMTQSEYEREQGESI